MSDLSQSSSGQWCMLHGCHQDDDSHDYFYPECERHLRPATAAEEYRWRVEQVASFWQGMVRKARREVGR